MYSSGTLSQILPSVDINGNEEMEVPEKFLLAALLERAFRDLYTVVDAKDRRDAINWFRATKEVSSKSNFTFKDVIESLNLKQQDVAYLEMCVSQAEKVVEKNTITYSVYKAPEVKRSVG